MNEPAGAETTAARPEGRRNDEMADAHSKPNHDYHLVEPSPWPLVGSISAFITACGAIMWMKGLPFLGLKMGAYVFGAVWDDKNVMKIIGPKAYQKPNDVDPPPDFGAGQ